MNDAKSTGTGGCESNVEEAIRVDNYLTFLDRAGGKVQFRLFNSK